MTRALIILSALAFLLPASSRAEVGADNPTGTSGQFNGNVTTGSSYDPYTGNATRSVTDLVVAGGVGAYPLAFTRTLNSRYTSGDTLEFGPAGSWRHSYQWSIDAGFYSGPDSNGVPSSCSVSYPDGRHVGFIRQPGTGDQYFRGPAGVRDRFAQVGLESGTECYLRLPDGGKIWFHVNRSGGFDPDTRQWVYDFTYDFRGIIDPYGLTTTITYPNGIMTVTEPAGRNLQLFYAQIAGQTVLDHIVGSDGRSVKYNYGNFTFGNTPYNCLLNVVYFGDANRYSWYGYQPSNIDPNGRPLISKSWDLTYAGPMKAVAYSFVPGANGGVYGQLSSENYLEVTTGNIGAPVSTLSVNGNTRTETRGDGPARTFTYTGYTLSSSTDFRNVPVSQGHDASNFINAVTDRNGNITSFINNAWSGNAIQATYPATATLPQTVVQYTYGSSTCPDPNNRDGNNPYYLYGTKNSRSYDTSYSRDANKRITQINYPNGAWESFTYNGFGQVLTHRLTSGGTGSFTYDGRGLMTSSTPPATESDPNPGSHPTSYYYDGLDRLSQVTDPRGNRTWFQYNTLGQTTRVTHEDGSYTQAAYNPDGTVASATDELNHTTSYAYDDYKRVTSATNPMGQTTSFDYRQDWVRPYDHTSAAVKGTWSPMGKATHFSYDENWRRTVMRAAAGSADDAWTFYGYDGVGNLTSVQDPRGNVTTFRYDSRNRRVSATDPAPFNNQITRWDYDAAGNRSKTTRPDGSFSTATFDSMNRTSDTYGFANEHTHYERDLAGNVLNLTDAKLAVYGFTYDTLNRKRTATYPLDSYSMNRTETWHYDLAGNLDQYKDPANLVMTIIYDSRNRPTTSSWSGYGSTTTRSYDAANRVTRVMTNNGETTVAFGYDDANRKIWEDQTLAGYPTRRVTTERDLDGNRSDLVVTTGSVWSYAIYYEYTQRNQLAHIYDYPHTPWFNYTYDTNGNLTKRQDVYNGVNDSINVTDSSDPSIGHKSYDSLNRPVMWENSAYADGAIVRSWYQYDSNNRITATWRDEQSAQGERFGYDAMNQLQSVSYNAGQVWTGTPVNATRSVTYNQDALNRQSVNENGTLTAYTPNEMNQYTSVGGQGSAYDQNFNLYTLNGWRYDYDAEKHLLLTTNGPTTGQFLYDGLGRCVKRTISGVVTLITYDGWKPTIEWDVNGNLKALNVYGAGPDEVLYRYDANWGRFRYHPDRQGNIALLLDWNGNAVERYTYDAFGQPTVYDWSDTERRYPRNYSRYGNRFMFQGREYFAELGIYDYRHRMYHPSLGRFLQSDPLGFGGGDANLFRFCAGDPVNRSDPMGLLPEGILTNRYGGTISGSGPTQGAMNFGYPPSGNGGNTASGAGNTAAGNGNGSGSGGSGNGSGSGGDGNGNGSGSGTGSGSSGSRDYNSNGGDGAAISAMGEHPPPHGLARKVEMGDGSGGGEAASRFSGSITVNGWPTWLTLPSTTPATSEQAAWTQKGMWPTVGAAAILSAPLWAPEAASFYAAGQLTISGANVVITGSNLAASWTAYQAYLYPTAIVAAQSFWSSYYGLGIGTSTTYAEGIGELLTLPFPPYPGP